MAQAAAPVLPAGNGPAIARRHRPLGSLDPMKPGMARAGRKGPRVGIRTAQAVQAVQAVFAPPALALALTVLEAPIAIAAVPPVVALVAARYGSPRENK